MTRLTKSFFFIFLFFHSTAFSIECPGILLYQKDGAAPGDSLGWSVSSAGDVNGDGKADFIIGAFLSDPNGLTDAGSAYVYSGADGELLYQKNGSAAGNHLGWSVSLAGDVNGDGKADFIIGSPNAKPGGVTTDGSAFLYSGATGVLLYRRDGSDSSQHFGHSVSSAGDVNGDGKADFIIGAPQASSGGIDSTGSAFVYSGATGELLYQKNGSATNDYFGWSVSSAGDVDGDGKADFIIGAHGTDAGGLEDAGSVFVYSGANGELLYQKNGSSALNYFGWSVSSAGDVDGDGKTDFLVGAIGADPGGLPLAGSAFLYSGASGTLLYQKNGSTAKEYFGYSVASAGDVNGDRKPDFIIGAPFTCPTGLLNAGSVFLYSGATGELLCAKNGSAPFYLLGYSVSSAGDVNGDGKAELIVGAPEASSPGRYSTGSVFVYSCRSIPPNPKKPRNRK